MSTRNKDKRTTMITALVMCLLVMVVIVIVVTASALFVRHDEVAVSYHASSGNVQFVTNHEKAEAEEPPEHYDFAAQWEAHEPDFLEELEAEYEPPSPPPDFPVPPTDNLAIVWNFFREHGFSPQATAAIIGNLQIESHDDIRPHAVGDEGMSHGIAQWNRGRFDNLQNHSRQNSADWRTLEAQLEFMLHELMTGQNVQWWRTTAETGIVGLECLMTAVCVVTATVAISQAYHRPGIPHMGESGGEVRGRIPRAEAALMRFTERG